MHVQQIHIVLHLENVQQHMFGSYLEAQCLCGILGHSALFYARVTVVMVIGVYTHLQ